MSDGFDLRDALLGRKYPETSVKVWMDDELFYRLEAARKRHAVALDAGQTDGELDRIEAEMEESAYVVHLRGISGRAGEDIISKALSEKPIKRDMYGREDDLQSIERQRLVAELSFSEHITKIVDPRGREQVFTEDNKRDLARALLGNAPKVTVKIIDSAIAQLSKDFADQVAEHSSVDF